MATPSDPVYPDELDDDLWIYIDKDLSEHYQGRFSLDQKRAAFEKTCKEHDDYIKLTKFAKRCRMNCVWTRRVDLRTPEEILDALHKLEEQDISETTSSGSETAQALGKPE